MAKKNNCLIKMLRFETYLNIFENKIFRLLRPKEAGLSKTRKIQETLCTTNWFQQKINFDIEHIVYSKTQKLMTPFYISGGATPFKAPPPLAIPSLTLPPAPSEPTGLGSILPPSQMGFGLNASNTCAKCGVTFRMTSDLVYHMRTHHSKPNQMR